MPMDIKLSVLDQSPAHPLETAPGCANAGQMSIALARACDSQGYHRYWVAEHHNSPQFAGPAPEVLVAGIASVTEHMRVGSGGVMLSHYSPYKVAEVFNMLCALFPGRIDLGIGRAPGGDAREPSPLAAQPGEPRRRVGQGSDHLDLVPARAQRQQAFVDEDAVVLAPRLRVHVAENEDFHARQGSTAPAGRQARPGLPVSRPATSMGG